MERNDDFIDDGFSPAVVKNKRPRPEEVLEASTTPRIIRDSNGRVIDTDNIFAGSLDKYQECNHCLLVAECRGDFLDRKDGNGICTNFENIHGIVKQK
jgi:hypothetical protein